MISLRIKELLVSLILGYQIWGCAILQKSKRKVIVWSVVKYYEKWHEGSTAAPLEKT
jgi:hypothetical protein